MDTKEVKRWYRTLEISAHCMCEQGYDASNLIKIAKYVEEKSGVKANPVAYEIRETIEFHNWYDKQNRKTEVLK